MPVLIRSLIAIVLLVSAAPAGADEKLWDSLQDQAITYYQQKRFREAVDTQRRALDIARETFGPDHMNVAESMDNLAIYDQALGNIAEAEELYAQALAILEKGLPPDDHYLAIFMNYVAGFYRRIGKPDEAKRLEEKARAIRAKT